MSTDANPQQSIKVHNLAANRDGQFCGTLSSQRVSAKVALGSLLMHGCLVLAFVLFDPAANLSGQAREIPVDVVTEPQPEQRPAALGTGEKSAASKEPAQAQIREPRQRPEAEANPKSASEAMSGPNPVAKPAAPQLSAAGGGPEAVSAKLVRKDVSNKAIVQERRPPAKQADVPARQGREGKNRWAARTGSAPPFASGPDSFRAVAMPVASESGGDAASYRFIVGGMLERVKHYPETARQRGATGIAFIGFILDKSGRITSVSLLRSSSEADLDAESVALVNRAAPFPPPPPGAQHSFAIEVAFGTGS